MKKITTLLVILVTFVILTGCGKDDTIDRLSKAVEKEQERSMEYEENANNYLNKIFELEQTVDNLTIQLSEKNVIIDDLNNKINSQSSSSKPQGTSNSTNYVLDYSASNSYLAMKFWLDGNNYSSSSTTWYSDNSCSKQISNPVVIVSPVVDTIKLNNGYTVYACMSVNGLVYTSYYPYLVKTN